MLKARIEAFRKMLKFFIDNDIKIDDSLRAFYLEAI